MVTPWIQDEGEATIGSSSKLPCDRYLNKPYHTHGNFGKHKENIRKETNGSQEKLSYQVEEGCSCYSSLTYYIN